MDKGKIFRDLHYGDAPFIIPNPWDVGTAKLLASCGFKALATTSAGYAFSRGLPDGAIGFETDDPALPRTGRGDRPSGFGRPRTRQGRQPRQRCRDDLRRRGRRAGRLLDRGSHRRSEKADLRLQAGGRTGRGGGRRGAGAEARLRLHRARREFPVGPPRSRRHDPAAAGLRGGWRRRALCAGHHRHRDGPDDLLVGVQARQRARGAGIQRQGARRGRGAPHFAWLEADDLRLRHDRERVARNAARRHFRLHPRRHGLRPRPGDVFEIRRNRAIPGKVGTGFPSGIATKQ